MKVRAGVAYVDVRLGSIEKFQKELAAKVGATIEAISKIAKKSAKDIEKNATQPITGFLGRLDAALSSIPGRLGNLRKYFEGVSSSIGMASFQMQNFGLISTVALTAPVAALGTLATIIGVGVAAKIEQAAASLKAILGPGYDVEALIKRLQKLAIESPIFNTSDLIVFTQQMVAAGLSIKDTEKFLASFGRIALRSGADIQKIPFALQALVQMMGKGKVSMEELRLQLGDALPGAMKIVSDALGVTTDELYEMVEAGELTGKELVAALTKLGETKPYMEGAAQGADTMAAKFQALKESIQTKLGDIFLRNADKIKKGLDELGPTFDKMIEHAEPALNGLVDGFKLVVEQLGKLVEWYGKLTPEQQDMVNKAILIAAVIGPVVLAFGALLGAVAGIASGFALLLNPVGLAIIAILILAIGFIYLWHTSEDFRKKLKEVWESLEKNIVEPFKGPVKDSIEEVKKVWNDLSEALTSGTKDGERSIKNLSIAFATMAAVIAIPIALVVGLVKGMLSSVKNASAALTHTISGTGKVIKGIIDTFMAVVTGDFERFKEGISSIWDGLWQAVVSATVERFKAVGNIVKGFVTGVIDFFKFLFDVLVGNSIVPDMVNAILAWFKKLVDRSRGFFSSLGGYFRSFYGTYVKGFIDQVKGGVDKVVNTFTSLPGKIKSAFSGAASWLYSAGKNIVQGLVNGVRSMSGFLRNAILNLIPAPVRNVVASALGISSPSKVFMEFGKFVVQGFIEGIKKESSYIPDSLSSITNALPPYVGPAATELAETFNAARGALIIENYHAAKDDDPRKQSEDWYFIVTSRGGIV